MKNRNIILGIDGVPFKLTKELADRGVMPHFKRMIEDYTFTELKSSIPNISSVSWSTIITGENAGEHGIYGFTDIIEGTYSQNFPNFNALRCKPFWHQAPEKKHVIINVPSTYPAKELNGIHIAGFVALDLEKAVYPGTILPDLKKISYQVDVDSKLAHEQSKDVFLNELMRVLKIREQTFDLFWDRGDWDNFMFVITGSDRIGHFFWDIYENPNDAHHEKFLDFFREIDAFIGDIVLNKLHENDRFVILSDHGMERIFQNVNINSYLEKEGYLSLSEKGKNYNSITEETKAFCLDPGRIYLNKKGKFPRGSVGKDEKKEILENLKDILTSLKYKKKKVIKHIHEKQDIYSGKMIRNAPDLVLIENPGYRLKGVIGKRETFASPEKFSGKHNGNAFLITNKDTEINQPKVENVLEFLQ